jgi:hypothetical protein
MDTIKMLWQLQTGQEQSLPSPLHFTKYSHSFICLIRYKITSDTDACASTNNEVVQKTVISESQTVHMIISVSVLGQTGGHDKEWMTL